MGSRSILIGTIIAGIVVMLALSSMPAYAGHPDVCPPGFELQSIPDHFADVNGNGDVCRKVLPNGNQLFIDDIVHS